MDSNKKKLYGSNESVDNEVPAWASSLFSKLKAEICAETHARVAYTVKLMLDEVKEEIKSALSFGNPSSAVHLGVQPNEECSCKELQHMVKCLKKCKKSVCHAQRKEEKKQAKSEYKAARKERKKAKTCVKSSSTEGETEEFEAAIDSVAPISNKSTYQFSASLPQRHETVRLVSINQIPSPPLTPRKTEPFLKLAREMEEETKKKPEEECTKEIKFNIETCEGTGKAQLSQLSDLKLPQHIEHQKKTPILNLGSDVLPSLSDSEFEVVSLPPNIDPVTAHAQQPEEESPYLSDYYDDEGSNGGSDAETELVVDTDSEHFNLDDEFESKKAKQKLYPIEELQKMSISMSVSTSSTSTTASTVVEDFKSTCSNEDNSSPEEAEGVANERQRTPYSIPPEEVKKINSEEIVKSQQLPPEFHRNRNPYASTVQDHHDNSSPPSQSQVQPEVEETPENARRPRDPYRVDVLPESLWEEAMTVAAKGYNAAKMVVGNLGSLVDPFTPISDSGEQRGTASTRYGSPTATSASSTSVSASSSSAGATAGPMNQRPPNMTRAERQLYEMGFTNHVLNATLLARHKNDLGKVITELLDH